MRGEQHARVSIDCAFGFCLAILGQKAFNIKKKFREEATFKDRLSQSAGRPELLFQCLLPTVRVLMILREALLEVWFVATDAPSHRLHHVLSEVLPNFEALMLGPRNVAVQYESASACKKRVGPLH